MKQIIYEYIDPITKDHYDTIVEDWNEDTHGKWLYDHPTVHIVEINLERHELNVMNEGKCKIH